jgi:integrase
MGIRKRKRKASKSAYCIDYRVNRRRKREFVGPGSEVAATVPGKRKMEIAEGRYLKQKQEPQRELFADFAKEFEAIHVSRKRAARRYRSCLKHLCREFGAKLLDEITPENVERYQVKRKEAKGRTPKDATVNREIATLKVLFNKAILWGRVAANPVKVKLFKERPRLRYLSSEEALRLIEAAREPLKSIITVAVHTGMRKSEILGLKWEQINLETGFIYLGETKNDEPREVPLNETLTGLLKRHTPSRFGKGYVFTWPAGRPVRDIRGSFEAACRKAGIENFRFHDLRHTWASHMIMSGEPMLTVMTLGGWKSTAMLQRYAHLAPDHLKRAAAVTDRIFRAQPGTDTTNKPADDTSTLPADSEYRRIGRTGRRRVRKIPQRILRRVKKRCERPT